MWARTYFSAGDKITAINPTSSGQILIGGTVNKKYLLVGKTDQNGNLLWTRTWQDHTYPHVNGIYEMSDGSIHLVGKFCNS